MADAMGYGSVGPPGLPSDPIPLFPTPSHPPTPAVSFLLLRPGEARGENLPPGSRSEHMSILWTSFLSKPTASKMADPQSFLAP